MPGVLNVGTTVVVEVEVEGTPPGIVHLTESALPALAVEVFVNVKVPPAHTTVSLTVKLAVAVGVVLHAGTSKASVWSLQLLERPCTAESPIPLLANVCHIKQVSELIPKAIAALIIAFLESK